MKVLVILLLLVSTTTFAQSNLLEMQPDKAYDNIHVQKLSSHEESTSFIIWVKKSVKPHFHKTHAESLYVLAGTAVMKIGDKTYEIKAGDFYIIPKNTVHAVQVTSDKALKVLSVQAPEFHGKDRHFTEKH